jgi:hypothetical protein
MISLDEPRGLIAFPSYHCTLSVLLILACWPLGIRFAQAQPTLPATAPEA